MTGQLAEERLICSAAGAPALAGDNGGSRGHGAASFSGSTSVGESFRTLPTAFETACMRNISSGHGTTSYRTKSGSVALSSHSAKSSGERTAGVRLFLDTIFQVK